ncbi:MAG TPA: DivIVA domain-containing protein [Jiangellaceae bacterium]
MLVVFVVVAVIVVFAVAAVAVGRGGGLAPAAPDLVRPSLPDGPVSADDVDSVRFAVGFRGYRMDQVDDVLDRLADEITERDSRITELEGRLAATASEGGPAG